MSLFFFFRSTGNVPDAESDAYHALGSHEGDFPLYLVEVAFSDGPLVVEPTWTDVSEYVRALSVRRGRSDELARVDTGTLSVVLDNRDRRFDPTYEDGPYYPNVLPMRQVRVRAYWGGVAYPVYRGFVEAWPQAWPEYGKDAIVEVTAFDALGALQLADALRSYRDLIVSHEPVGYWRLGEPSGSTAADSSGNGNDGVYVGAVTLGQDGALNGDADASIRVDTIFAAEQVTIPDDSTLDVGNTFTVEAWVKLGTSADGFIARKTDGSDGWQVRVTQGGIVELELAASDSSFVGSTGTLSADTWYHVVVTKSGSTEKVYVNGSDVTTTTGEEGLALTLADTNGPLELAVLEAGASIDLDEVAVYPTALTAAQVGQHYLSGLAIRPDETAAARIGYFLDVAGWPSGLRDLDTGRTTLTNVTLSDGSVSDAIATIAQAETGLLYVDAGGTVQFADRARRWLANADGPAGVLGDGGGSEIPISEIVAGYTVDAVRNHVVVTPAGGTAVTASDTASQAAYYRRSLEHSILSDDQNEAESIAAGLLGRFKDPALRVERVSLVGGSGTAIWPHVLGADLGARYTVRRRPPAGGTIETDVYLEAVSHDVQPGPVWVTSWILSPAESDSFWLLEDDTFGVLGETTRLAY